MADAGSITRRGNLKNSATLKTPIADKKKKRSDRLSPGKTQKPKGTFSRIALSCDGEKEPYSGLRVNRIY